MLIARNGTSPNVDVDATVAASAHVIGDVRIGARAYVDHGAILESSGPGIEIEEEAIVFAGAVVRSVGGLGRPPFRVRIGARTLVSPGCVLTGCEVGRNCYVATAAIVLQGATIGDDVRIGAGAIVHATTVIPEGARVGMRHVAVPVEGGFLSTADIEEARRAIADIDFFGTAFGAAEEDQAGLHTQVMSALLEEVRGWRDEPLP